MSLSTAWENEDHSSASYRPCCRTYAPRHFVGGDVNDDSHLANVADGGGNVLRLQAVNPMSNG